MRMIFRPASEAAVAIRKQAYKVSLAVANGGAINRIYENFIIRATNVEPGVVRTQVIELPTLFISAFAGRPSSKDYYLPGSLIEFPNATATMLKKEMKVDEVTSLFVPWEADDSFVGKVPWGKGLVQIGSLSTWASLRYGINNTTGTFYTNASSVSVGLCPGFSKEDEVDAPFPPPRSFLICRMNALMGGGPINLDETGDLPVPEVPRYYPAINSEPFSGSLMGISAIEFSAGALGLNSDETFMLPWTPIEWGPGIGTSGVYVTAYDDEHAPTKYSIVLVGYTIALSDADTAITNLIWVTRFSDDNLSGGDAPSSLPALPSAFADGYGFPAWAVQTIQLEARDAGAPPSPIDNLLARGRMYAVGDAGAGRQATMGIVRISVARIGANLAVKGIKYDSVSGTYISQIFNRPPQSVYDRDTYVLSIDVDGSISATKLTSYRSNMYDLTNLLEHVITTYCGASTAPDQDHPYGLPRLFCVDSEAHYKVVPAGDPEPPPFDFDGQPAHLEGDLTAFGTPEEQEYFFLSPSGVRTTIDFGAYYPGLYDATNGLFTGKRVNFGIAAWVDADALSNFGNTFAQPMCQFAPGYVACLVFPRSQFTSDMQDMRIMIIHVESGLPVILSPVLIQTTVDARFSLTCFEQGTIDEFEVINTLGRLLIGVSSYDNSSSRRDGYFTVTGLNKLSWFSREPSNTTPVYAGNVLLPASMGFTTRQTGIKPTPYPE